MQDLIVKGAVTEMKELMSRSGEAGMKTFDQSLFELIQEGAISLEEGLKHADSENDLRLQIKLNGKSGLSENTPASVNLALDDSDENSQTFGRI